MATAKTAQQRAEEKEAQKKAEAESKRQQEQAAQQAEAAEKERQERLAKQAEEASKNADKAKEAASEKAAPVRNPIVTAVVVKVPNSGRLFFNGQDIAVARVGQVMKLPFGTAAAFPEFLELGDEID